MNRLIGLRYGLLGGMAVASRRAEMAVHGLGLGEEARGVRKLGNVAARQIPIFTRLTGHIESELIRTFSDSLKLLAEIRNKAL